MKEILIKLIGETLRTTLTRKAGGQGIFVDFVELAVIAAKARKFRNEKKAAAYALINLKRRCGERPVQEDIDRFMAEPDEPVAATEKETPGKKPAKA
jgi:hypothetical protein